MFAAVREGPSPYTQAQRAAWVPAPREGAAWTERLSAQHVVVAEGEDGPLGFMSLAKGGYVDLAYVVPHARGTGLFRRLYEAVEAEARARGETRLTTHASLMAEPAFAAVGFAVTAREVVEIAGERLARAAMEKRL